MAVESVVERERASISATEWLRTYADADQYVRSCRTDEAAMRLAVAMADDARDSGYLVEVSDYQEEE